MIFTALRSLNEGTNMTRPAMFVGIASLVLNIPLNFLFVFGWGAIPAMGGAGCGAATSCIYFFQAVVMFVLIYRHPVHRAYRRHIVAIRKPTAEMLKHVFKVGFPVGMSVFCEVMLFCAASLVLAPQGYVQVGSHQVACTVAGMTYMVPMSVGLAASIRVAYHLGDRNRAGVKSAILSSYLLVLAILLITATCMVVFNREIVCLFNDEPAIVTVASFLLLLGALFQLPDCLQTVSVGVLRGFRDTAALGVITVVAYWVIGFPIGFILARTTWLTSSPWAAKGIWVGFIFGLATAAGLLLARVRSTYRREFPVQAPKATETTQEPH
jgi:MATE family multidrug resistance protein